MYPHSHTGALCVLIPGQSIGVTVNAYPTLALGMQIVRDDEMSRLGHEYADARPTKPRSTLAKGNRGILPLSTMDTIRTITIWLTFPSYAHL